MNPYSPPRQMPTAPSSRIKWEIGPAFMLVFLTPLLANFACRVSPALGASFFVGATLTAWTIAIVQRNQTWLFSGTLCSLMIWGLVSIAVVLVRPAICGAEGHFLPRLGPMLNVTADRALLLLVWPTMQLSLMLAWLFSRKSPVG